jgi:hypothetical protein
LQSVAAISRLNCSGLTRSERHSGRSAIVAGDPDRATVFINVSDPVGAGLVDSLARPGGNATGFAQFGYSVSAKREVAGIAETDCTKRDASCGPPRLHYYRWCWSVRRNSVGETTTCSARRYSTTQ